MSNKQFITKKLDEIYNHFGKDAQLEKLSEECNEFIMDNDKEEIADVFIVAAQLVLNNPELMGIVEFKINRTLERIKDGFYASANSKSTKP